MSHSHPADTLVSARERRSFADTLVFILRSYYKLGIVDRLRRWIAENTFDFVQHGDELGKRLRWNVDDLIVDSVDPVNVDVHYGESVGIDAHPDSLFGEYGQQR